MYPASFYYIRLDVGIVPKVWSFFGFHLNFFNKKNIKEIVHLNQQHQLFYIDCSYYQIYK